jgi:redox-sensitive bicupin YhaK (pirin superfamily)
MSDKILEIRKQDVQFTTENPFLFCAHHKDAYPKGNRELGPDASLAGRNIGMDFEGKDGWRMYHGERVPGFPVHPHRGFETVSVTLRGYVDHSDSLGAAGRYGNGDVQWMTAGAGCQHSEMFPLIHSDRENPLEFFQIWLNLPKKDKFTDPHYKMLWSEDVPDITVTDADGNESRVRIVAGSYQGQDALSPSPASWAQDKSHRVRILVIRMDPHAELVLDGVSPTITRNLYFYQGTGLTVEGTGIPPYSRVKLSGDDDVRIIAGGEKCCLLLLEGEPIPESVVQYGPFVMNTEDEIRQAFEDYRKTAFGGWPWERPDMVHDIGEMRFARFADGTEEKRGAAKPVE